MSEIESRNVKKIVQEIMRECSEQSVQVHENFVQYYVSITLKLLEIKHLHNNNHFSQKMTCEIGILRLSKLKIGMPIEPCKN